MSKRKHKPKWRPSLVQPATALVLLAILILMSFAPPMEFKP